VQGGKLDNEATGETAEEIVQGDKRLLARIKII